MKYIKTLLVLILLSSISPASDEDEKKFADALYNTGFEDYVPVEELELRYLSNWKKDINEMPHKRLQNYIESQQLPYIETQQLPLDIANVDLAEAITDPSALQNFYENPSLQAAFNAVTDPIVGITALTGVAAYALYYKYQQYLKDQKIKKELKIKMPYPLLLGS
jgi:hypothetical protein